MNLVDVRLRTGSASWPDVSVLGGWTQPLVLTIVIAAVTSALWLAALPGRAR